MNIAVHTAVMAATMHGNSVPDDSCPARCLSGRW